LKLGKKTEEGRFIFDICKAPEVGAVGSFDRICIFGINDIIGRFDIIDRFNIHYRFESMIVIPMGDFTVTHNK